VPLSIYADGVTEKESVGIPAFIAKPSVPTLEMLHKFISSFPVMDVLLVTVSAPAVSVPVVWLKVRAEFPAGAPLLA
jgi:hypothetical protein